MVQPSNEQISVDRFAQVLISIITDTDRWGKYVIDFRDRRLEHHDSWMLSRTVIYLL